MEILKNGNFLCNFAKADRAGSIPLAKYFNPAPISPQKPAALIPGDQILVIFPTTFELYSQKKQSQMLKSYK